ncbi:MAG TPA: hypothetical protein VLE02_01115 [Nitrosarchaeum sp.]|nr:hypothetical protein [Nitrosarchaeum sp.]
MIDDPKWKYFGEIGMETTSWQLAVFALLDILPSELAVYGSYGDGCCVILSNSSMGAVLYLCVKKHKYKKMKHT